MKPYNILFALLLGVITIVNFQNCGQAGDLILNEAAPYPIVAPQGVDAKYETISMQKPTLPDLKIFLILDNSDSMRANQIRLKDSIANLFNGAKDSISEFNSSTYIVTTAQLNRPSTSAATILADSNVRSVLLNEKSTFKLPENIQDNLGLDFVFAQRSDTLNNGVTGLLAGDVLGYRIDATPTGDTLLMNYVPAPIYGFETQGTTVVPKASVDFQRGQSLTTFVDQIGARIDVINPEKISLTKAAGNLSFQTYIEDESATCALARVLKSSSSDSTFNIQPGDIASFILVTDENDADPNGDRCISQELKFKKNVYDAQCYMPTSAVQYVLREKNTTLKIRRPYKKAIEWSESFRMSRSEQLAMCKGRGDTSSYQFKLIKPKYKITYDQKTYIIYEGGNKKLYSSEFGLNVSVNGLTPTNCTSVQNLKAVLNVTAPANTEYEYSNIQCQVMNDTVQATKNFSSYRAVSSGSTCSAQDQTNILSTEAGTWKDAYLETCVVLQNSAKIDFTLSQTAFSKYSVSSNDCDTAVASYCQGYLNNCSRTDFKAYVSALTKNSTVSATNPTLITTYRACADVSCSRFPELCNNPNDSTSTLAAWATTNGFTCSPTHTVTKTVDDIESNWTTITKKTHPTKTIDCSSSCDEFPEFCNVSSFPRTGKTILSYNNNLCQKDANAETPVLTVVPIAAVNNPKQTAWSCNDTCKNSLLCGNANANASTLPISQYIQSINTQAQLESCSIVSAKAQIQNINAPTPDSLACTNPQLTLDQASIILRTPDEIQATLIDQETATSPRVGLKNFVVQNLKQKIGTGRYSMATFTTKPAQSSAQFTAGVDYEQLMDLAGADPSLKASIHDDAAFTNALKFLAQQISAQMKKTFSVVNMPPGEEIRRIWYRSQQQYWIELQPSQVMILGSSFTLLDNNIIQKMNTENSAFFYVEYY